MELDKDTLNRLIIHFGVIFKELNTPDPDEEENLEDESPEWSSGYNTAIHVARLHLEMLRDGEMKLRE